MCHEEPCLKGHPDPAATAQSSEEDRVRREEDGVRRRVP